MKHGLVGDRTVRWRLIVDKLNFMPHGFCFLWNPRLLALQVVSDSLIAAAYFAISFALWFFVRRRPDIPFTGIFTLFGTFIVACGLTHVLAVVTIWNPVYWLDGWTKALTAIASVGTAIVLLPIIPQALALRSPAELERLNAELSELIRTKEQLLEAYERQHHVATTLQNALMPHDLPQIRGITISKSYRAASHGAEVGGDWFDAFMLSEHQIVLTCGDVAGHGLSAASLMGSVRRMLRTAAREDDDPSVVLGRVNRMICADDAASCVTAFYGVLDLISGVLRYGLAGHPPPFHARGVNGVETQLLAGSGVMLGVDASLTYTQQRATLTPGDLLVLYTDGLIEHERDVTGGLERLGRLVAREADGLSDDPADAIQAAVFATAPPRDDAAILTVRIDALGGGSGGALHRVWRADASDGERGRRLRIAVMSYLAEYTAPSADLSDTELIVGELLGNVARHTPGSVRVELERHNGEALLTVADTGPPFSRRDIMPTDRMQEHGRGLALISLLSHDLSVEQTTGGNIVRVRLPVALA